MDNHMLLSSPLSSFCFGIDMQPSESHQSPLAGLNSSIADVWEHITSYLETTEIHHFGLSSKNNLSKMTPFWIRKAIECSLIDDKTLVTDNKTLSNEQMSLLRKQLLSQPLINYYEQNAINNKFFRDEWDAIKNNDPLEKLKIFHTTAKIVLVSTERFAKLLRFLSSSEEEKVLINKCWNGKQFDINFFRKNVVNKINSVQKLKIQIKALSSEIIPAEICQLHNLQSLEITGKGISDLPFNIGHLNNLEALIITNTLISDIPVTIKNLKKLKTLTINDTPIQKLPTQIGELSSLQKLDILKNEITNLPIELLDLKNLTHLYFFSLNKDEETKEVLAELKKRENFNLFSPC